MQRYATSFSNSNNGCRESIHLEPIALIGHDVVPTRGRCSTDEGIVLLTIDYCKAFQEMDRYKELRQMELKEKLSVIPNEKITNE